MKRGRLRLERFQDRPALQQLDVDTECITFGDDLEKRFRAVVCAAVQSVHPVW